MPNQKKFLDAAGVTHLVSLLNDYPDNEVLGTVIDAIQEELNNLVVISTTAPTADENKIWINDSSTTTVTVPTVSEMNAALANKTDKVASATNDNFAALDSNGNLTDSGHKHSDYITPSNQHIAVFYGLAKVAGDTTQSSSANPAGTYTPAAKSAIQNMIGIENGISFVESITSTTPIINGVANTRYKCGEVSTITINPPTFGTIDVLFTSGSTATVLTAPSSGTDAVRWPTWFNAASLATNTIYEILITDGIYGSVTLWPS